MNILLIGSGGREYTLAWKLSQSDLLDRLYIAPGNAGTAQFGENLNVAVDDFEQLSVIIREKQIQMVIVGPEVPLVLGIQDYLTAHHPQVFCVGPSKTGAQLEGSKSFAKEFMASNDIPTATYLEVTKENLSQGLGHIEKTEGPIVLKADGLAAGKGVIITEDKKQAQELLQEMLQGKFGSASHKVVIEAFLDGIEFSVFVLTDGSEYVLLPHAKDYKRIGEGDTGLNTGGMGCVSPPPFANEQVMDKVIEQIINPTIQGLQNEQITYHGFIFFGLILVDGDPFVIEYNCRLGDPETEVILPRMENDLLELFVALKNQDLSKIRMKINPDPCATVMMVSGGYPEAYKKGFPIEFPAHSGNSLIIHAGTKQSGDQVVTNGGRVLAVTSFGHKLGDALKKSYQVIDTIHFQDSYYRKDIGFDVKLD